MAPAKGNTHAKKLTTIELKAEAFKQYLDHLASGLPKQSWTFEHPDMSLTAQTMDKYIRDEPNVFSSSQMRIAEAKGYNVWVKHGLNMMLHPKNSDVTPSPAIYQIMMRNIHKWDRQEATEDNKAKFCEVAEHAMNRVVEPTE